MILGKDVSTWNNYQPGAEDFVMIKMGGGDSGLYMDSKAALNYSNAVNAGKVVGGYWFAGGTDPVAEADFFVRAMSPPAENDVYALDWEIQHSDPVGWCQAFVQRVHDRVGVWCLIYLNRSTKEAYDWSPVTNNCGLWIAAPDVSYDADIPNIGTYVMQQGPIVGGIDQDAFFGTREELQKYGWHASVSAVPSPTPPPATVITPTPVIPTAPTTPAGQGSVQNTNTPDVLPGLTNNVPPAPVVPPTVTTTTTGKTVEIQTTPNTNTITVGGTTSTLKARTTSQNSTPQVSKSWWARLWNYLFGKEL